MSAIILDSFKVKTLQSFISSLATNSLYLGIARPQYWDTIGSVDLVVPNPENTIKGLNFDWEDMLSFKKITITDAHTGIFKEQWQANVRYDTYRHDWDGTRTSVYNGVNSFVTSPTSVGDAKCYVVTASYGIYACIKHPVVAGVVQPSIYSPETGTAVGVNTGVVKTLDGYYWKFLAAATSPAEIVNFSSTYYHPITTIALAPAPSDPSYPQWLNQGYSANFKGGIYTINTLTSGTGYNGGIAGTRVVTDAENDAQFKVIGNGTGLQYTVTYGAAGSIVDVEITNPGQGYSHATITAVGGAAATFDIIFSPPRGLGVDPLMDLVSRYLLINVTLAGAEGGDFTISNEFRKIVLVHNPYSFGTTTVATASTLDATLTLNVGTGLSASAYPVDAIVTGATSGAKGRVVDFNTTTGYIRVIRTSSENLNNVAANNNFLVAESLTSNPGTGTSAIVSITNPEVASFSGNSIYTEYRMPITRRDLQTEDIKLVIKF